MAKKGEYSAKRLAMGEEAWAEYTRQRINAKNRRAVSRNPEKFINRRREVKLQLIAYKGGKCQECGYNKPVASAYHFHHRNPAEKEFEVGYHMRPFEVSKVEADKCDLLCSNCHAEHHEKEKDARREATIRRLRASA